IFTQPISVFVEKKISGCRSAWKHRFEHFLEDTQHLHRQRSQRNCSNTLAAKCFRFTKEAHTLPPPIYVAVFSTRPYFQQLTCTRADLGLKDNGRVVSCTAMR